MIITPHIPLQIHNPARNKLPGAYEYWSQHTTAGHKMAGLTKNLKYVLYKVITIGTTAPEKLRCNAAS